MPKGVGAAAGFQIVVDPQVRLEVAGAQILELRMGK
jgi:hypothetical protein